jgi:hypothetical protein
MKKTFAAAATLFLVLPMSATAATFEYVNKEGKLATIEAAAAEMALQLIAPLSFDSGVRLVTGIIGDVLQTEHEYQYVSTADELKTVKATSPEEAIRIAPNRMANSGVQLVK